MSERLREGTIKIYHNFRDEEVHRVTILNNSQLVVFLSTTFLLYSLKERQVMFAHSNSNWNFRDVRAAAFSNSELVVHTALTNSVFLLNVRTGQHRVLLDDCKKDHSYSILSFPLGNQLLVQDFSEYIEKTEFLHHPSGLFFKLANHRVQHRAYDLEKTLVHWQYSARQGGAFGFHLYDINAKLGRDHKVAVKDRVWGVQSVQRFTNELALITQFRTEKSPPMMSFCSLRNDEVVREILLPGTSLLVWVSAESRTALLEEYSDLQKRKLSLVRLEKDRVSTINSLDLRPDEIRVDCCQHAKMSIYVPLLGEASGKSFKVCRVVSKNSLALHLLDKAGLLQKYSTRLGEEVIRLLNQSTA